jgi:hypothetical protein
VATLAILSFALPSVGQVETIDARVESLDLATIVAPRLVLSYSDGAEKEGQLYAAQAEAAIGWYTEALRWTGSIRMAVLTEHGYLLTTTLPYPTPFTESGTRFIVIADSAESHPGFELWDLDDSVVNTAWLFHEMGHVIARDLGIGSANLWVNELIANIMMAGYIRAERPELIGYQSGMPPRFADANRFETLAEFDRYYFNMGQLDYLWFHFHIARVADFMISGPGGTAGVVEGLVREFPAGADPGRVSIEETIDRLERISPGVATLVESLLER